MKTNYYPDVSEFVLNYKYNDLSPVQYQYYEKIRLIDDYAQLHETDLHPSLFIPWDFENNKPLEKPERITEKGVLTSAIDHSDKVENYNQAKSKVIFEGFEILHKSKNVISFDNNACWVRFDLDLKEVNHGEISKVKHLSGKASFTKEINEKFGINTSLYCNCSKAKGVDYEKWR